LELSGPLLGGGGCCSCSAACYEVPAYSNPRGGSECHSVCNGALCITNVQYDNLDQSWGAPQASRARGAARWDGLRDHNKNRRECRASCGWRSQQHNSLAEGPCTYYSWWISCALDSAIPSIKQRRRPSMRRPLRRRWHHDALTHLCASCGGGAAGPLDAGTVPPLAGMTRRTYDDCFSGSGTW
jgi:hypothetical protein